MQQANTDFTVPSFNSNDFRVDNHLRCAARPIDGMLVLYRNHRVDFLLSPPGAMGGIPGSLGLAQTAMLMTDPSQLDIDPKDSIVPFQLACVDHILVGYQQPTGRDNPFDCPQSIRLTINHVDVDVIVYQTPRGRVTVQVPIGAIPEDGLPNMDPGVRARRDINTMAIAIEGHLRWYRNSGYFNNAGLVRDDYHAAMLFELASRLETARHKLEITASLRPPKVFPEAGAIVRLPRLSETPTEKYTFSVTVEDAKVVIMAVERNRLQMVPQGNHLLAAPGAELQLARPRGQMPIFLSMDEYLDKVVEILGEFSIYLLRWAPSPNAARCGDALKALVKRLVDEYAEYPCPSAENRLLELYRSVFGEHHSTAVGQPEIDNRLSLTPDLHRRVLPMQNRPKPTPLDQEVLFPVNIRSMVEITRDGEVYFKMGTNLAAIQHRMNAMVKVDLSDLQHPAFDLETTYMRAIDEGLINPLGEFGETEFKAMVELARKNPFLRQQKTHRRHWAVPRQALDLFKDFSSKYVLMQDVLASRGQGVVEYYNTLKHKLDLATPPFEQDPYAPETVKQVLEVLSSFGGPDAQEGGDWVGQQDANHYLEWHDSYFNLATSSAPDAFAQQLHQMVEESEPVEEVAPAPEVVQEPEPEAEREGADETSYHVEEGEYLRGEKAVPATAAITEETVDYAQRLVNTLQAARTPQEAITRILAKAREMDHKFRALGVENPDFVSFAADIAELALANCQTLPLLLADHDGH